MKRANFLALAAALVLARLAIYALVAGGDPSTPLCRYDCGWYTAVAADGYAATSNLEHEHLQHAWPFFPLLPILLAFVHRATGLDFATAACLVASVCTILIADCGQRYRELTRRNPRASTWLLLTVAMPFGFYFATGYSEALYALLSFATLLGLARRNALAASLPCALLGATRPTGILLAPAIATAALRQASSRSRPAWRVLVLLPCLLAVSGLLAWIAYCAASTGDPLKFVHAQADWHRHLTNPLHVLIYSIHLALHPHHVWGLAYEPLWSLAGLGIALYCACRRRWTESFFLAATVVLALSSGRTGSIPRFVGASPIFLLFLADVIDRLGWRLRCASLAVSAAVQLVMLHYWLTGWHGLI